jgi:Pilus assembly protein, PilO
VNLGGGSSESKQQIGYYALALAAALLVLGGGYMIFVKPSTAKASFLQTRIAKLNQEATAADASYREAEQLSKVQLADLFDLTRAMPDDPQVADVLVVLGRLAANSNVQFNSIKPGTVIPLAGYRALPMEIELQGNFYDLMEFLYELRHLVDVRQDVQGTTKLYATGRLFAVNGLQIAIVAAGDLNRPQLTATIDLDAFSYGLGPALGAPVAPVPGATTATTTTAATTTTSASAASAPTTPAGGSN